MKNMKNKIKKKHCITELLTYSVYITNLSGSYVDTGYFKGSVNRLDNYLNSLLSFSSYLEEAHLVQALQT